MSFLAGLGAGVVSGGIDLLGANAQQKASQQLAEQNAAAAQAQQQQAFNQQLGYINSSNAAQRSAIEGVQNPAMAAAASMPKPTAQALPGQANMGGQVYGGGSGSPLSLANAQAPGAAAMRAPQSANAATSQQTPQFGPPPQGGAQPQQQPGQLRQLLQGGAPPQGGPMMGGAQRFTGGSGMPQPQQLGALASLPQQRPQPQPMMRSAQAQ